MLHCRFSHAFCLPFLVMNWATDWKWVDHCITLLTPSMVEIHKAGTVKKFSVP